MWMSRECRKFLGQNERKRSSSREGCCLRRRIGLLGQSCHAGICTKVNAEMEGFVLMD